MADSFYSREIFLIQTFMRGCFWYALCILTSYRSYQGGHGGFHPLLLLLVFPAALFLWAIRTFIKKRKLCVFLLITASILMAVLLPLPWYFFAVECLLHLSAFRRPEKNLRNFGAAWETWIYWAPGVAAFFLLLLLHTIWSEDADIRLAVQPSFAAGCILASFGIFLVLNIINNYMKNFHEYFGGRKNVVGKEAFFRARRSNYTMIGILLAVGAVVMFLFTFLPLGLYRAIWNGIKYLFSRFLGIAFSSMDQLGSSNDSGFSVDGQLAPSGEPDLKIAPEASGVGGQILGILLILGIVLAIVWFFIKFFKGVLVGYHAGTDTAEFVSMREENIYEKRNGSFFHKKFGNSNREMIRKGYYHTILKRFGRMSEERKRAVRTSQTPEEWSRLFAKSPKDREQMEKLTGYYEKARFGREDCTDKEAAEASELVSQLGRGKAD